MSISAIPPDHDGVNAANQLEDINHNDKKWVLDLWKARTPNESIDELSESRHFVIHKIIGDAKRY